MKRNLKNKALVNILCIETASTNCSVALAVDGQLGGLKEDYELTYSHSERLHLFIQELLKEKGMKPENLQAIAVSKGPGSYTGLRIGVSAAKGLCFALGLPLISVSTLTALAHQVKEDGYIIPMLDARRMEVYTSVFNSGKEQVEETSAKILKPDSFSNYLDKQKTYFIGSGVAKFKEICNHPNAVFVEDKLPSAREMVKLASEKFQTGIFEDVAYFEPYYLKDFIAG